MKSTSNVFNFFSSDFLICLIFNNEKIQLQKPSLSFQEVWFVAVMALMVLIVLIAFVATIWVRRQRSNMKNLGHYNGKEFLQT